MPNLLAELESAIEPEAPETEAADETEAEPEETKGQQIEASADDSSEDEAADEGEGEPEVAELDDEAEFKLGDETVTGKELKAQRLMQADYTRKTQALAEERKAFEQERDSLHDENEELKTWVRSLQDPAEMEFELERYFPEQFDALRQRIIEQAIEEQDMTERERDAHRRARKAEHAEKARAKDAELEDARAERKATVQRTNELRQTFNGWLEETMTAAGLDPKNPRHQKLVRTEIANEHKGKTWTRETFESATKVVASDLGKTPPAKGKAAVPPPVSAGGRKPIAGKAPRKPAKSRTEDTESFFEKLRRG